MLPVRVKVLSTSSCSLSQASSLLQRFLSGDACCDSLARDYVANVANALQDSISRRAGESGDSLQFPSSFPHLFVRGSRTDVSEGKQSVSAPGQRALSSAHRKQDRREKPRVQATYDNDDSRLRAVMENGEGPDSVNVEVKNSQTHKKKRKHSALENGLGMVSSLVQELDQSNVGNDGKKRRKKEEGEGQTRYYAMKRTPEIRLQEKTTAEASPVNNENFSSEKNARKKKKKQRKAELKYD